MTFQSNTAWTNVIRHKPFYTLKNVMSPRCSVISKLYWVSPDLPDIYYLPVVVEFFTACNRFTDSISMPQWFRLDSENCDADHNSLGGSSTTERNWWFLHKRRAPECSNWRFFWFPLTSFDFTSSHILILTKARWSQY